MAKQVVIQNPVINSPFEEPKWHFRFDDDGITDDIANGRRDSCYFVPIAQPRKKGPKQLLLDAEWTRDRIEENRMVTARNLWIPAVNNAGTWGRWAFVEIADPWDAKGTIRAKVESAQKETPAPAPPRRAGEEGSGQQ